MQFRDRHEAGQALADALSHYRDHPNAIVLAIPRGGVVVGYEVATRLGLPLDIHLTRKIGAPYNPELALGAMSGDGSVVLDQEMIGRLRVPATYLEKEQARQKREIERQMRTYRGQRPTPDLTDKIVILVDDGVATGSTTLAAIRALKQRPLRKLVLAIPVGPPDAAERLSKQADEAVFLATPERFWAVGGFYLVFDQTPDARVIELLHEANKVAKA
jgi:putative phosphoribosyl transferase